MDTKQYATTGMRFKQTATPPGTEGADINATRLNRLLTISATRLFGKFKIFRDNTCVVLPFGLIVKKSRAMKVTEAHTVRFVAKNTNIPVPKIYCAFLRKKTGMAYIVQQKMKGEPISAKWQERSEKSKSRLLQHLKLMLDELRAIEPPPGTGVHDVCGGAIWDIKISWDTPMGPFSKVDKFHLWLREGFDVEPEYEMTPESVPPSNWDLAHRVVKMHRSREFELKFTHADLNWSNVFVEGDKVTAIIDWGSSGWYPDYWEYAQVRIEANGPHCQKQYVTQFLDSYEDETQQEGYRAFSWEHCG